MSTYATHLVEPSIVDPQEVKNTINPINPISKRRISLSAVIGVQTISSQRLKPEYLSGKVSDCSTR